MYCTSLRGGVSLRDKLIQPILEISILHLFSWSGIFMVLTTHTLHWMQKHLTGLHTVFTALRFLSKSQWNYCASALWWHFPDSYFEDVEGSVKSSEKLPHSVVTVHSLVDLRSIGSTLVEASPVRQHMGTAAATLTPEVVSAQSDNSVCHCQPSLLKSVGDLWPPAQCMLGEAVATPTQKTEAGMEAENGQMEVSFVFQSSVIVCKEKNKHTQTHASAATKIYGLILLAQTKTMKRHW